MSLVDHEQIKRVIESTRAWWELPRKTQFHHILSQYITKMVRFSVSRKIRSNLYALLGDPYSQSLFNAILRDNVQCLLSCGLNNEQIDTLRIISNLVDEKDCLDNNLERISGIVGVGAWTLKSIRLILDSDSDIFLYEDSYIRSRLAELYGVSSLTPTKAKQIGLEWTHRQTDLSKFLWRIKKSGTDKIRRNAELERDDFL